MVAEAEVGQRVVLCPPQHGADAVAVIEGQPLGVADDGPGKRGTAGLVYVMRFF